MKDALRRLTYANVVSTLALFLAMSGGAAYAAIQLGKHSVGTKQLKNHSVGTRKLKRNSVTGAEVKKHSLTAEDFEEGSLPAGPEGPVGPSDLYSAKGEITTIATGKTSTLASLTLPEGEYEVIAAQTAQTAEGEAELDCYIYAGEGKEASFYTKLPATGLAGDVTGMAALTLTASTTVSDECTAFGGSVIASEPKLVALKVGAIH